MYNSKLTLEGNIWDEQTNNAKVKHKTHIQKCYVQGYARCYCFAIYWCYTQNDVKKHDWVTVISHYKAQTIIFHDDQLIFVAFFVHLIAINENRDVSCCICEEMGKNNKIVQNTIECKCLTQYKQKIVSFLYEWST